MAAPDSDGSDQQGGSGAERGRGHVAEEGTPRPAGWPTRKVLAGVWVAAAVGFAILLAVASSRGPLDDPDPARQRPGFLDGDGLPAPAPAIGGEAIPRGRRAVVFFVRPEQISRLCRDLPGSTVAGRASVMVIVSAPSMCPAAAVVDVDRGALARRFGMPSPVDGGPPVGYAVVDAAGRIRYRTLDPGVARHLDEVATILAAAG